MAGFKRYESAITVGPSLAESAISAIIWTDSVDTRIKWRDEHLRADNVFAIAQFPTMEFHSAAIVETSTGVNITGSLRVRGIGKSVTFHATRSTTAGPPRYSARGGRVTHGVRDHPMGHHQAGQGHPRRDPKRSGRTRPRSRADGMRALSLMRVSGWQRDWRDGTCAAVMRALVSGEWKVLKMCWDPFDRRVNCLEMQAITQFIQSSPVQAQPFADHRW